MSDAPIIVINTSKQIDSVTASSVDVYTELGSTESLTGVRTLKL